MSTRISTNSSGFDSDLLENAQKTLNNCKAQIDNLRQVGQLQDSKGDSDPLLRDLNEAKERLKDAIDDYSAWVNGEACLSALGAGERLSKEKESDSPIFKWRRFVKHALKLSKPPSALDHATKELRSRKDHVEIALAKLMNATSQRSYVNERGSFYMLGHCRKLSSDKFRSGVALTGRYEETGSAIYALVTQAMRIDQALENRKKSKSSSSNDKVTNALQSLYHKLGIAYDKIIAFVLAMPFDLEGFEFAMKELKRIGTVLLDVVDGKRPPDFTDLLDGKKLRKEAADGKGNKLAQDIDAVVSYLKEREFDYESRKSILVDKYPSFLHNLDHLGLKDCDLSNNDTVVESMKRSRTEKGLGLPIIAKGNNIAPLLQKKGGYGLVSKMKIPDNASGVDIALHGHLVAVKIATADDNTCESIKIANLRMLREADRWAAVSSDPRNLEGGGRYLTRILGVWDDFQDNRPGLVASWGQCDMSTYLANSTLSLPKRLELMYKVAQGVQFLHTCNPVIVHGDLKAANVIMVDGEPRLTDFGIAKCLDQTVGYTTRSNPYTDDYRAPEIQHRELSLVQYPSKASDVYAFGCVMFEILSGKTPFNGFDKNTRRSWVDQFLDFTPIEAELSKPNPHQFEDVHLLLMRRCFSFHASRRPTIEELVEVLKCLHEVSSS